MSAKLQDLMGPSMAFWLVLPACLCFSLLHFSLRGWQGGRISRLLSRGGASSRGTTVSEGERSASWQVYIGKREPGGSGGTREPLGASERASVPVYVLVEYSRAQAVSHCCYLRECSKKDGELKAGSAPVPGGSPGSLLQVWMY